MTAIVPNAIACTGSLLVAATSASARPTIAGKVFEPATSAANLSRPLRPTAACDQKSSERGPTRRGGSQTRSFELPRAPPQYRQPQQPVCGPPRFCRLEAKEEPQRHRDRSSNKETRPAIVLSQPA